MARSTAATGAAPPRALPAELDAALGDAIVLLTRTLRCQTLVAPTHRVVQVQGWADGPETINAVAVYLVGLLASAISRALVVRAQLENTARDRLELLRNIQAITGTSSAALTSTQKEDERNPWIAEGLWHLCLFLSSLGRADLHLPGPIVALDMPHIAAKDHGFDVVGLFRSSGSVGMSFVECKAYANDPSRAVNAAVGFFREVDSGDHDPRARQAVASMREALPASEQSVISASLWKDNRAYVPNPHYDANSSTVTWTSPRPSFRDLKVPAERIVIMPHGVANFSQFFDDVADAMLLIGQKLSHV